MKKQEAINYMYLNPYKPVRHKLFTTQEYLYSDGTRQIFDENGYLFEDFQTGSFYCGLRMRTEPVWDNDWEII